MIHAIVWSCLFCTVDLLQSAKFDSTEEDQFYYHTDSDMYRCPNVTRLGLVNGIRFYSQCYSLIRYLQYPNETSDICNNTLGLGGTYAFTGDVRGNKVPVNYKPWFNSTALLNALRYRLKDLSEVGFEYLKAENDGMIIGLSNNVMALIHPLSSRGTLELTNNSRKYYFFCEYAAECTNIQKIDLSRLDSAICNFKGESNTLKYNETRDCQGCKIFHVPKTANRGLRFARCEEEGLRIPLCTGSTALLTVFIIFLVIIFGVICAGFWRWNFQAHQAQEIYKKMIAKLRNENNIITSQIHAIKCQIIQLDMNKAATAGDWPATEVNSPAAANVPVRMEGQPATEAGLNQDGGADGSIFGSVINKWFKSPAVQFELPLAEQSYADESYQSELPEKRSATQLNGDKASTLPGQFERSILKVKATEAMTKSVVASRRSTYEYEGLTDPQSLEDKTERTTSKIATKRARSSSAPAKKGTAKVKATNDKTKSVSASRRSSHESESFTDLQISEDERTTPKIDTKQAGSSSPLAKKSAAKVKWTNAKTKGLSASRKSTHEDEGLTDLQSSKDKTEKTTPKIATKRARSSSAPPKIKKSSLDKPIKGKKS